APRARLPAAAAALLLAALLGYRTLLQFEVWRSPVSFWEHVASLAPYSELAQVNLGLQYQGLGQPQLALQRLETAAALDGQPGNRVNDAGIAYDGILILLADLNLRQGRHAAALDNLQQAEAYNAGNPDIALLRQVVQAASGDPTGR
ncbi:MAG TPA: tetratricopeptide repeat protein, partial [Gammaproteobacteria bacterium]